MTKFDHIGSLIYKNGNLTPFLPKSLAPSGFDFSSPSGYETDYWDMQTQTVAGKYNNGVGSATMDNSGGLPDEAIPGLTNSSGDPYNSWESDSTLDTVLCSDSTVGNTVAQSMSGRIVLKDSVSGTSGTIIGKYDSSGWVLLRPNTSDTIRFLVNKFGGGVALIDVSAPGLDSTSVHSISFILDTVAGLIKLKSSAFGEVTASYDASGTYGPVTGMSVGKGFVNAIIGQNTLYAGLCVGANAQAFYAESVSLPPPSAPEKVYLLLGHSIIVGSANLANVGPEYAHYDDPIPGLNYAELLACPDDDGVGSCSTESSWATFDGDGSFGPELAFARYVADNSPHISRIIKCATSGTDFVVDWNPATSDGYTLYSRATAFIDARLSEISDGYEVVGILIADGTNDCLGASVPTNLETAYIDLIAALRTKYGAAKVAISRINSGATIDVGELATARAASDAIATASANNILIDMDGYGLLGDGIHPDTPGQLAYGLASATALVTI